MALNSTFCTFFLPIFTKTPVFYTENPEFTYQKCTFWNFTKNPKKIIKKIFLAIRNFS